MVLQHGFTDSLETWYELGYVDALKREHQLILVDARGHGASDKPHDTSASVASCPACSVTGLADLDVTPAAVYLSDYRVANEGCELEYSAELARNAGVVSVAEAEAWVAGLRRLAASGQFWCAVMVFVVAGRRV